MSRVGAGAVSLDGISKKLKPKDNREEDKFSIPNSELCLEHNNSTVRITITGNFIKEIQNAIKYAVSPNRDFIAVAIESTDLDSSQTMTTPSPSAFADAAFAAAISADPYSPEAFSDENPYSSQKRYYEAIAKRPWSAAAAYDDITAKRPWSAASPESAFAGAISADPFCALPSSDQFFITACEVQVYKVENNRLTRLPDTINVREKIESLEFSQKPGSSRIDLEWKEYNRVKQSMTLPT